MNKNLDIKCALEMLISRSKVNDLITIDLMNSYGYILGEDIFSPLSIPPFNRSPLDGFAARATDIAAAHKENPVSLKVIDFVPAGKPSTLTLTHNAAMRIMTGAKIPQGADVVIPFEQTEFTEEAVTVFKNYKPNSNISFMGEDIEQGDKVLSKGDKIDAAQIGILASIGKSAVKVHKKPKIAIMSTGDELVDLDSPLKDGQIRNSNSYTIAALVRKLGAEPLIVKACADGLETTKVAIKEALSYSDMIITTGGVSVGDKDFVTKAFQEICDDFLFWRVKIKPGTPIAVAMLEKKFMFGLSGNPAAAFITFQLFVKPVILKSLGYTNVLPLEVETTLLNGFTKVGKQNRFVRAKTIYKDNQFFTELPENHSSGVISSLAGVNSLLFIPSGEGPYQKGQRVKVQFLDWEEFIGDTCYFNCSK